jgi:hypothetical protein
LDNQKTAAGRWKKIQKVAISAEYDNEASVYAEIRVIL